MRSLRVFATLALSVLLSSSSFTHGASSPSSPSWPSQTFDSEPSFHPPQLLVDRAGTPAPGYLFFAPAALAPQVAPLIMTDASELIWQGPRNASAFSFGVQTYRGAPVLVYWNGTIFPEPLGRGYGVISILDQTYREIASITLPGNFRTSSGATFASNVDLHEIYVTNRDTVLITANNATQTDLTSVGGATDGWIVDCLVYEIDIATNRVLFRWSALEHRDEVPLHASVYPLGAEGYDGSTQARAWGYFHINAVAPLDDGYIISSRYYCSIIALDKKGHVRWRVSGRDGADFTLGPGASFCFQHDIRPVYADAQTYRTGPTFRASLHDNANAPIANGTTPTSGLVLEFDTAARHVALVQRYRNPQNPLYATAQGSAQRLAGGHVFLGHGVLPIFEEFDADGRIVMTIQYGTPRGTISYRAFRQAWVGCPTQPPAVNVTRKHQRVVVAMSWNGATEYDHWIVRGRGKHGAMRTLRTVPRTGFETTVEIPHHVAQIQVEAIAVQEAECKCQDMHKHSRSRMVDTR